MESQTMPPDELTQRCGVDGDSMGPRTDPCGTPYINSCSSDVDFLVWTVWVWPVKHDWNQFKTVSWVPNDYTRVWSKWRWSVVSNAALRSRRTSKILEASLRAASQLPCYAICPKQAVMAAKKYQVFFKMGLKVDDLAIVYNDRNSILIGTILQS